MAMPIKSPLSVDSDIIEKAIGWRRHIHAHPELAFNEKETSDFIAGILGKANIEVHRGLAKTGVVGKISRGDGPTIGLRADMDALPLHEKNSFAHKSVYDGRMHACGHDGHTAMLLAAALTLVQDKDWQGTVVFIFQPAEESHGGGKKMIADGLFQLFNVDAVFGMHNWPTLEVGKIAMRSGPIMAGSDNFEIVLHGQGTHAAMPHLGQDLILMASRLVIDLQGIVSREIHPLESGVISVTQFHAGDAYNILTDKVVLRGTVRYFKPQVREYVKERMENLISGVCAMHSLRFEFHYNKGYMPTVNTPKETEICQSAAMNILGADNVEGNLLPSMGSEDFSFMLHEKPGCYVWLGNGKGTDGCMLHNPHYDFNDRALPIGVQYWVSLVKEYGSSFAL